jgi:hypothetical protein
MMPMKFLTRREIPQPTDKIGVMSRFVVPFVPPSRREQGVGGAAEGTHEKRTFFRPCRRAARHIMPGVSSPRAHLWEKHHAYRHKF